MKKAYLLIIICFIFLSSCDDRGFENLNDAPVLLVDGANQSYSDSVKISLKSPVNYTIIILDLSDNNGDLSSLRYTTSSNYIIKQDGQTLNGSVNLSNSQNNQIDLEVYPQSVGKGTIELTALDAFNAASGVTVTITAFQNIVPTADLEIVPVRVKDDLHYELDATGSFDGDQNHGGFIDTYEYHINDQIITLTHNQIDHPERIDFVFGQSGLYAFKLRVRDSDGIWSSVEINKNIN